MHDQTLQDLRSAAPRGGTDTGPNASEIFSAGDDPRFDVQPRHLPIRAEIINTQPPYPAQPLKLTQRHSERLGIEAHPVVLQPGAELIIVRELLIVTLDRAADVHRQDIDGIEHAFLFGHNEHRVSAVPLHQDDLPDIPQPGQRIVQTERSATPSSAKRSGNSLRGHG